MRVKASEDLQSFFAKKLSVLKGPSSPAVSDLDDDTKELPIIREKKSSITKKKKDTFQSFFDEQLEEAIKDLVLGSSISKQTASKFTEAYLRRRKAILGY